LIGRATDINDTNSTGSPRRETAAKEANATTQGVAHPAPFKMRRRIGSTSYEVEVRFSSEGGETMDEKILRLVRDGAVKSDKEGRQ
jgi:hypothetical protein